MSDETKISLSVTIGDQAFRVRVLPSETERYERIAAQANQTLSQVIDSGILAGPRALAMALFQVEAELDELRESQRVNQQGSERLRQIINRIDEATGRER